MGYGSPLAVWQSSIATVVAWVTAMVQVWSLTWELHMLQAQPKKSVEEVEFYIKQKSLVGSKFCPFHGQILVLAQEHHLLQKLLAGGKTCLLD